MSITHYTIVDETIKISRQDSTASITVITPWDEAVVYAQELVGGNITILGLPTFVTAAPHYSVRGIYANDVTITPFGTYNANEYNEAKVVISYAKPDSPQDEGEGEGGDPVEIADISYSVGGQELTLPKAKLKKGTGSSAPVLDDDNAPNPMKIVPTAELTIRFKNRPDLNQVNWTPYVGNVNEGSFFGHGDETVMFQGVETKRTVSSDGNDTYEHNYKFSIQFKGWNNYFEPETGTWQELRTSNGQKCYTPEDLMAIFEV